MHSIWQTLAMFFNIAVFKNRPQDLSASIQVLYVAVGLALLLSVLRFSMVPAESISILRVLLEVLVPGVVLYFLLYYFKHTNRFAQTFAAICGSGSIIYALALPFLPAFYAAAAARAPDLSVYAIILLDLWSIAVVAFILRHALEVGLATSVTLAIALGLTSYIVVDTAAPLKAVQPVDQPLSFQSLPFPATSVASVSTNSRLVRL